MLNILLLQAKLNHRRAWQKSAPLIYCLFATLLVLFSVLIFLNFIKLYHQLLVLWLDANFFFFAVFSANVGLKSFKDTYDAGFAAFSQYRLLSSVFNLGLNVGQHQTDCAFCTCRNYVGKCKYLLRTWHKKILTANGLFREHGPRHDVKHN